MTLYSKTIESPVGKLMLVASDKGLRFVGFDNHSGRYSALDGELQAVESHPILGRAELELMEYFTGQRQVFSVKLDMVGSVFQIKAWRALCAIPYGETRSYAEQAQRIGAPDAVRGVSLHISQGAMTGIIGPNGSGKSTLLRLLAGIAMPGGGSVSGSDGSGPATTSRKSAASRTVRVSGP